MKALILSVPTGQGHHQAAKAVYEYFSEETDVECKIIDVFENVNPRLAESVDKGYLLSTKVTPKAYGRVYGFLENRDDSKNSGLGILLKTILNKKLMHFIKDFKPDVIVATHVFAAIALSHLKRKYPFRAKTVAIITDFTMHPFWEEVDLDYYVTACEALEFQAIKKGYAKEQIKPFGIPIRKKFAKKIPKSEAREIVGIDEKFTVMMMMGSMGYGDDTLDIVKSVDSLGDDLQIIVVCGNNKKMKRRLSGMSFSHKVYTLGFVDNVDVLMDSADCIITKPGGLSTSEALAKELPIIMLDPIPGQEDRNKEFMLNNGIALNISKTLRVEEAIYQLKNLDYRIGALKENMKFIRKPESTKNLCEFLMSL